MQLSSEQFGTLSALEAERFVVRVVFRVSERFPQETGRLGAPGTRAAVVAAMIQARTYGLVSETDLFRFVCLAFALGAQFDADPALPWAGATLRSRLLGTPTQRLDRTYALALAAFSGSGRPWVPLPASLSRAARI